MRYNTHLPREEDIYFRRMLIIPGHPEEIGIPIGIEIPYKYQISSISSMTSLDILRTPSPPNFADSRGPDVDRRGCVPEQVTAEPLLGAVPRHPEMAAPAAGLMR